MVSYLVKGKMTGLLLDAEIRGSTAGAKSLDDVVRRLVSVAATRRTGLDDNALESEIQTATGVNVREFLDSVVRGKSEIDYKRYLDKIGVSVSSRKSPPSIFFGIEFERIEGNQARIRRVNPGSPAETAKLDGGDVILAMDSDRVTFDNLASRIHSKPLGKPVALTVMRGERLLALTITPGTTQTETWTLGEAIPSTPEQVRIRDAWMGTDAKLSWGRERGNFEIGRSRKLQIQNHEISKWTPKENHPGLRPPLLAVMQGGELAASDGAE